MTNLFFIIDGGTSEPCFVLTGSPTRAIATPDQHGTLLPVGWTLIISDKLQFPHNDLI